MRTLLPMRGDPLRVLAAGIARGGAIALRLGAALALVVALAIGWLAAPGLAGAQTATPAPTGSQKWSVQVGGDEPPGSPTPTIEPQAFFPDPLTIHVGDTVNWKWAGFHTVTFNSGKPDLPFVLPGPGAGELTAGPAFFPVGVGDPSEPSIYDGTQQLSSGAPVSGPPDEMKFSLTFTKTGTFGYICSIHPGMRGNIAVREAGAPLTESPDQAFQRGQAARSALIGKIAMDQQQIRPAEAGGVQTVASGVGDNFGVSAIVFLPGNVTVKRGDAIVWYLPDPFNPHTITFSSGAAPPDLFTPRPQPSGPPQLVFTANVASPTGGTSYTGSGYLNSGILTGGASFVATIDAPPGTYTYYCIIHGSPEGGMKGTITVTD